MTSSANNSCCEIVSLKKCAILQLKPRQTLVQAVRSTKDHMPTYQFVGSRQVLQCVGQIKTGSSAHTLYQTPDFRRHGKPDGKMPVLSTSPTSKSQLSGASWIGNHLLDIKSLPLGPRGRV